MAPRIETKLRTALAGYTTEQVLASRSEAGETRQLVARTTFHTAPEATATMRFIVRTNGGARGEIVDGFEYLAPAITAYADEE